jgi:hypothetical protein
VSHGSPVLASVNGWQMPEVHKSPCRLSHSTVLAHGAPAPSKAAHTPLAQ